jgi:hypothetical protein
VFSKKRGDCEMHAVTVDGEAGEVFTSGGAVVPGASLCIAGGCSRRWPRCWFRVT